jgi:hypothetical protein
VAAGLQLPALPATWLSGWNTEAEAERPLSATYGLWPWPAETSLSYIQASLALWREEKYFCNAVPALADYLYLAAGWRRENEKRSKLKLAVYSIPEARKLSSLNVLWSWNVMKAGFSGHSMWLLFWLNQ